MPICLGVLLALSAGTIVLSVILMSLIDFNKGKQKEKRHRTEEIGMGLLLKRISKTEAEAKNTKIYA